MPQRDVPFGPGQFSNTVNVDGLEWNVEECTLASAVFNDFTTGTQTIAVRLVLSRQPKKEKKKKE